MKSILFAIEYRNKYIIYRLQKQNEKLLSLFIEIKFILSVIRILSLSRHFSQ